MTTVICSLSTLVDQFAEVHAQINALQAQSDSLKAQLIASGEASIPGTFVRAAITTSKPRQTVDWKGVAAELEAPPEVVSAYTKIGDPVTSLRLYAL